MSSVQAAWTPPIALPCGCSDRPQRPPLPPPTARSDRPDGRGHTDRRSRPRAFSGRSTRSRSRLDEDARLVADRPGVVRRRQENHVARAGTDTFSWVIRPKRAISSGAPGGASGSWTGPWRWSAFQSPGCGPPRAAPGPAVRGIHASPASPLRASSRGTWRQQPVYPRADGTIHHRLTIDSHTSSRCSICSRGGPPQARRSTARRASVATSRPAPARYVAPCSDGRFDGV